MKPLGKKEWERLHGVTIKDHPSFTALGWSWTPLPCKCPSVCFLRQDSQTQKGKT